LAGFEIANAPSARECVCHGGVNHYVTAIFFDQWPVLLQELVQLITSTEVDPEQIKTALRSEQPQHKANQDSSKKRATTTQSR
jgi:hypothetical protein